jgi:hypothetical protein
MMTTTKAPQAPDTTLIQDELEILKQKADLLDIGYAKSVTVEQLKAKIQAKTTPAETHPSAALSKQEFRQKHFEEATKLVRIQIACMNPSKRDMKNEMFTFANPVVGAVTKVVPFNKPWHVPHCIFEMIRDREFQHVTTNQGPGGIDQPVGTWVKEFSVQVLPQLTEKELKQMAVKQAVAEGLEA